MGSAHLARRAAAGLLCLALLDVEVACRPIPGPHTAVSPASTESQQGVRS